MESSQKFVNIGGSKMKTIGKVLFVFVIILIFLSCFSPWSGYTGMFSISIGGSGSGRTVLPWNEDLDSKDLVHEISLKGPGQEQTISVTGTRTVQFSVVPGMWNITIEAYFVIEGEEEEENERVAFGSRTVDIKPGFNGAIKIEMGKPSIVEMVWVQGGTFQLGKELGKAATGDVTPVSNVTVSSFFIGKYEVTQAQWQAVMESLPNNVSSNYGIGGAYPIYYISWYDMLVFCNKLSIMEGLTPAYSISDSTNPDDWGAVPTNMNTTWNNVSIVSGSTGYRLPTEAQWEYAAKGGNTGETFTYAGSDNPGEVAWYGVSNGTSHEVGTKAPNGLGLYDMSGNVWELCWDWYGSYTSENKTDPTGPSSGSIRVQHSGSWNESVGTIRSVSRGGPSPCDRYDDLGFRVVRP
jgi:formylglycine-generating enzyme required for sulfatase activity